MGSSWMGMDRMHEWGFCALGSGEDQQKCSECIEVKCACIVIVRGDIGRRAY